MYHSIDESGSCVSVSPSDFRLQMAYLKRKGYQTLSLSDFCNFFDSGLSVGRNSVVITFDDGYRNNYEEAFPILREYGFRATIFLITDYIGKTAQWTRGFLGGFSTRCPGDPAQDEQHNDAYFVDLHFIKKKMPAFLHLSEARLGQEVDKLKTVNCLPVLSWSEIREMSDYGIEFGAHTCSHYFLSGLTLEEAERQISESKAIIETGLAKTVNSFSYPYGDLNREIVQLVRDLGFLGACGTSIGTNGAGLDRYALKRIPTGGSVDDIRFCLSRAFNWYSSLREQTYRARFESDRGHE